MERRLQVEYGSANSNTQIFGVWASYPAIQNQHVAVGRHFTESEERGRRRVPALGARVGGRLGEPDTAALVGQTIRIRGIPFEVIGVLAERGDQGWSNPDEAIYIPLATAQFRVFGTDRVRSILVQAVSAEAMDDAIAEIDAVIRREHRLRP